MNFSINKKISFLRKPKQKATLSKFSLHVNPIVHGCLSYRLCMGEGGKFTPLPKIPTTTAIDFKLGMNYY